jgi:uncharacterized protein (TIGR02117 family)
VTLLRWPLRLIGGTACVLLLYWTVAAVAMLVPVNREFSQAADGIDVFISSNGIHVDLILPVSSPIMDWRRAGVAVHPETNHLAFGWGQREFYLKTRTWADFSLITGFRAVLWRRDTLVHVTERAALPGDAIRLRLSPDQYSRLIRFIRGSFAGEAVHHLPGAGYGAYDNFYEGTGTYSPFMTCNEWANHALSVAGVRAALWSPLPYGVMRQAR